MSALRTPRLRVLVALLAVVAAAVAATPARAADPATGVVDVTSALPLEGGASAGTGMVIGPGLVLTNHHVIEGAGRITVRDVTTGHRHRAAVVGYDVDDDVAVLRLVGSPTLATVSIGDSAGVRRGDAVTAVGNAGGVGGAPDQAPGTVTGLHRAITVSDGAGRTSRLTGLIRTDADIREGDSGGPLLDALGRVVGMDTAASVAYGPGGGGSEGFAIPINRAMAVARLIIGGHSSARVHIGPTARLGVQMQDAATRPGALVGGVAAGLPAARAGIAPGDVVVGLSGARVASSDGLARLLRRHHPGDLVRITWVTTAGARLSAAVRLASGPPT